MVPPKDCESLVSPRNNDAATMTTETETRTLKPFVRVSSQLYGRGEGDGAFDRREEREALIRQRSFRRRGGTRMIFRIKMKRNSEVLRQGLQCGWE